MTKKVYAVIRTGGASAGKIITKHRSWAAADRACPMSFHGVYELDAKSCPIPRPPTVNYPDRRPQSWETGCRQ